MTNKILFISILPLILFKIIAVYFTEFSLYGDEAQYWLWSKSLDIGYFSKPPLLSWFLYGYTSFFGDSFFTLKMFPLIIYILISFAVYKLCLCLSFSQNSSTLCSLSFFIIPSVSVSSFLISTDLLLLLFWVLALTKLLNVRNKGLFLDFLLLGLFLGLAFLAKYAAVYFFISLILLIIFDKKTLYAFRNNMTGSIVFCISFIFIFLPNIFWNINNEWVTFSHTSDNANLQSLNLNFYEPLKFLSSQILMIGPILVVSSIICLKYFSLDFENKFLLIFSTPIFLIVLIESFLVRANANWAAPALISFFILLFRIINIEKKYFIKINFIFNYLVVILLFSLILVSSKINIFDRIRGINFFAMEIAEIINDKDLVVSDRIIFSNISYELYNKSNNFYMPYEKGAPIKNHFQISSAFKSNIKNNFYFIGHLNDISYLSNNFDGVLVKEFFVPFNSTSIKLYEINFK